MGTLMDELLKAGLVPKDKAKKHQEVLETERRLRERKNLKYIQKEHIPYIDELDACTTVVDFKQAAKKILLQDSTLIQKVIQKAHRLQSVEGGKKLIWYLYQVKANLEKCPSGKVEQYINRALRRSGGTFELPG